MAYRVGERPDDGRLVGEGHAEATPEVVMRILRAEGPHWLSMGGYRHHAPALHRAHVTVPAPGGSQEMLAAFAVGLEPALARDAVRALWRQDDEGLAVIREHLPRAARHR
ncbi:MAG TPA: hypothetical protein VM734_05395 [Kofleriaceae bacterium]|nr:hypothetical protein [Kofleriaceae bacterium]